MTTEQRIESKPEGAAPRPRARWMDVLDAVAKLIGAGALVACAYVGNTYQSRMTGTTLLSQRELAESQLRASMFTSLVQPLIGSEKSGVIRRDREGLLVALLALNFHEHFEAKPLMESLDGRLASQQQDGMTPGETQAARNSLRSIARRVTAQEMASIIREQATGASSSGGCTNYILTVRTQSTPPSEADSRGVPCQGNGAFEEPVTIVSPDRRWTLIVVAKNPDWQNETFGIEISASTNSASSDHNYRSLDYHFNLSWFNFPLTDNTLLPDGNRFAVTLRNTDKKESAVLEIVWFPKDYVTPRERPLNYQQYLELIGKKSSKQ